MFYDDRTFASMERMLADMNRLFDQTRRDPLWSDVPPAVPFNVWANEDALMVTAAIAGLDPDSLHISVAGEVLTIRGNRTSESQSGDERTVHRRERRFGEFSRSLQLPYRVDADQAEARYNGGILSVALRRPEDEKPRTIAVQAA
ncbi:MAG: Hsp20/alpha crystallin family protein [Planctomycetes bacterium]|nr:Hsp20/alpha crystallin family protein [Planctomycetota bacterium]